MAAIRVFLAQRERAFEPELVKAMTTAYDLVVSRAPHLAHSPDMRERVALRIIALATEGLRDPRELAGTVIEDIGTPGSTQGGPASAVSRDRT